MGTPLGPKYMPYTYMDPLGYITPYNRFQTRPARPWAERAGCTLRDPEGSSSGSELTLVLPAASAIILGSPL